MNRSFRARLALRGALTVALVLVSVSIVSIVFLRSALDSEIDATALDVAAIHAAALTDDPTGAMHFHDWELTPEEAASVQELVRYAQVWQADGTSLLRSQYMTSDLPLDRELLEGAAGGRIVWSEGIYQGAPVRIIHYPLERLGPSHERHVLQVAAPLTGRNRLLARVGVFLGALSMGATALSFGGAWWLATRAMRPVHEVMDQAEEIGATSLARRIHAYADTREYQRLVEVLNGMLTRLERAFESQRRFTADASHELRSPLTSMRGELELALRRDRAPDEYRRVLESALEEVIRLSRVAEDLLILARSDSGALIPRVERVDTEDVIGRVLERVRAGAAAKGVELRLISSGDVVAELDPVLLGQVAWNLLDNAIRFTPEGGTARIDVRGDRTQLILTVEDNGAGFPPELLERAFDRFTRADAARGRSSEGRGTGLGLAIVKAVAEAHGGEVVAANPPNGGARVTLRFPRRVAVG